MTHVYILNYLDGNLYHTAFDELTPYNTIEEYLLKKFDFRENEISYMVSDVELEIKEL